jgi:hypothetical protein
VVQQACFFLRQHHDPPSPIGEAFKHGESVSVAARCNAAQGM